MEWLPILVVTVLVAILGLYYIVKRAVKDALKEYFRDENKNDKLEFENHKIMSDYCSP